MAVVVILSTFAFWTFNHATLSVDPSIVTESWEVVGNGSHNAFTDLISWKGAFYLVYRSASNHLDPRSKLVVLRSADARTWGHMAELALSAEDIRDPKFAVIDDQLFLYALRNASLFALPYATVYTSSEDGKIWAPWRNIELQGWLFWRPKTHDGLTWYVPAYSSQHNQTALFQSEDGKKWDGVSVIDHGEPQSEVEITFSSDGNLNAVIRMESQVLSQEAGSPSTLIASASPPYHDWTTFRSRTTRLDGPVMFWYQDSLFAVGRSEPEDGILFGVRGGLFNKKRTSIFLVSPSGLNKLTDLPGDGDTSYPGIVVLDDEAYVSYYTNDIRQDFPWLIGQFLPTSIRLAKLNLPKLKQNAVNHP